MKIKIKICSCLLLVCIVLIQCKQKGKEETNPPDLDTAEYLELCRPQYHFSPPAHWMNDPNGLVYKDGEYHLFYQFYPDSNVWGPMHWGHAVSKDLLHWSHLPIALFPDSLGYIFSGSVVIDHGNTSGFGIDGKDPMVAIFTQHNPVLEKSGSDKFQYQSIAYSNDNGRSFHKYKNNPVVPNPGIRDFRDPKVIWHAVTKQWIMVLAAYDKVIFYNSTDLKEWKRAGEFGIVGDTRLWECPDLFPVKVEGSNEEKWILITSIQKGAPNGGTATSYFVGDFDGKTFTSDPAHQKWLDYGKDNYAMVTYSDIPADDGRVVAIGWMSNWQYAQVVPTEVWRSACTIPRELRLDKVGDDYFLRSLPVREIASIEKDKLDIKPGIITQNLRIMNGFSLAKIDMTFKRPIANTITIRFSNSMNEYMEVSYNPISLKYEIDRSHAGNTDFSDDFPGIHSTDASFIESENIHFLILIDHSSIELFADNGFYTMTEIFFTSAPFDRAEILGNEDTNLLQGMVWELKNTWR